MTTAPPPHSSLGERRRETERKLTLHIATYRRDHASDTKGTTTSGDHPTPLDVRPGTR